ncbi:hypothetical protein ACP4OV_010539 [Aristida adscensionis]
METPQIEIGGFKWEGMYDVLPKESNLLVLRCHVWLNFVPPVKHILANFEVASCWTLRCSSTDGYPYLTSIIRRMPCPIGPEEPKLPAGSVLMCVLKPFDDQIGDPREQEALGYAVPWLLAFCGICFVLAVRKISADGCSYSVATMDMLICRVFGMDHVRVHPKFLHSNATSHKWALGAEVTVGFVKDAKHHIDVQGFNAYHQNRLIKSLLESMDCSWKWWTLCDRRELQRELSGHNAFAKVDAARSKMGMPQLDTLQVYNSGIKHLPDP